MAKRAELFPVCSGRGTLASGSNTGAQPPAGKRLKDAHHLVSKEGSSCQVLPTLTSSFLPKGESNWGRMWLVSQGHECGH